MRPLVIVTGPDKKLKFGWWATRLMLCLAGLKGHYLTARNPGIPDGVKGIVVSGGDDIEPEHYGLSGDAGATYDRERDALEMEMVRHALICGIPIFGICRGAQLINVVLGGSLFTDIRQKRKKTPNRNSLFPIKWAYIDGRRYLGQIVEKPKLKVNSLHNQAIDRVAEALSVAARDRDSFIQAIEANDQAEKNTAPFILGVQWHPEYMPYSPSQRKIFQSFAKGVRNCDAVLSCEISGSKH